MNMRKIMLILAGIGVGCTILGLLLLSGSLGYLPGGQSRIPAPGQVTVNEEKLFSVSQVQAISISTVSSNVRWHVTSGDQVRVHLHGTTAGNPPELGAEVNGGSLEIVVRHKPQVGIFHGGITSVALDVYVPAKALSALSIETVSGDAEIPAVEAEEFRFRTVSGSLKAEGIEAGQSRLVSTSGDMKIRNFDGDLEFKSVSGKLDLVYDQVAENRITAETTSGDVRLDLPEGAGFTLEANSVSGEITCSFPISVSGSRSSHSLAGTAGEGENQLKIHTVSGDVRVF